MTIAIICEYNPLHNGHAAQIARLREAYPGCRIVCIMSGAFTQRGSAAVLPPVERARAAVGAGADLVLELPQPWASASAEFFARGGVAVADGLCVVDALAFGVETDDLAAPMRVAERLDEPEFAAAVAVGDPAEGAAARTARLYREGYGDDGGMLSKPNNRLALEYCRALRRRGSEIVPLPMKREGSDYHDGALDCANPSATAVRGALAGGCALDVLSGYLPPSSVAVLGEALVSGRCAIDSAALDRAVLAHWRLADPAAMAGLASLGGGLSERICAAAQEAVSVEDLIGRTGTKVYTNARIRRALLQGMLGVTEADLRGEPTAARVFGANAVGRALLREIARRGSVAAVTKYADLASVASEREVQLCRRADALYGLAMREVAGAGEFVRVRPFLG